MLRLGLPRVFLLSLALTSCSSAGGPGAPDGRLGASQSAIAYGSADSTHTAVVALLGNAGGSSFAECSGTIVQVKNGQAYVLTAGHCCDKTVPSVVVMSNDYSVGEQYIFGGTPAPPAYAVTAGSVYFDSKYDPNATNPPSSYDFCMLKFAAPANAAVIPVAQPGQDGLSLGVQVEHVGFGVTDTSTSNSGRRTGTAPVDLSLTATDLKSSQGGSGLIQGVCEGDSGGPALVPAGAMPSQQMVVGTTSYGSTTTCSQNTYNDCMRVTSETGPGGFITDYLADTPTGTPGGNTPPPTCQDCATSAESGACQSQTQACVGDQACYNLNTCIGNCTTQACVTACETTAGATATSQLNALDACICNTACTSECASSCTSSSSSSSASSSSGGTSCGVTTMNPTCDACLNAQCCSEAEACVGDVTCNACLVATPAASCASDALLTALNNCVNGTCNAQCNGGTTSSTSAASSAGSTSTSGTTSASTSGSAATGSGATGSPATGTGTTGSGLSGSGTTGTGTAGGGTTGSGSSNGAGAAGSSGDGSGANGTNESSGCSVSTSGSSSPGAPTPLAGLVLGALLAFSRRRRAA